MNRVVYDNTVNVLHVEAEHVADMKRPDYTQESNDVLQNFKDAARDAGITPLQAWLVHFQKQYSAVARYVKNPLCTPSESMLSRFVDLRNYIDLGYALFSEENFNVKSSKNPNSPNVGRSVCGTFQKDQPGQISDTGWGSSEHILPPLQGVEESREILGIDASRTSGKVR